MEGILPHKTFDLYVGIFNARAHEIESTKVITSVLCRRYMDDPSFTEEQLQLLSGPGSADTRRMFNVLTDEEVTGYKCGQCENVPLQVDSSVRTCLASLAGPVQVVWRDQRCLYCGETGDRRGPALVTRPRRHGVTASRLPCVG